MESIDIEGLIRLTKQFRANLGSPRKNWNYDTPACPKWKKGLILKGKHHTAAANHGTGCSSGLLSREVKSQ